MKGCLVNPDSLSVKKLNYYHRPGSKCRFPSGYISIVELSPKIICNAVTSL